MLKILYSVLLGIILAFFIGLGIEAFYPTQKYPEYPSELQYKESVPTTAVEKQQKTDYDVRVEEYQTQNSKHALIISIIAIASSILFLVLSLVVFTNNDVFSNGFLIASLLTLIYGMARGFENDNPKIRFLLISIGLVFALVLGYLKFGRKKN
jgi:hypothetical protein